MTAVPFPNPGAVAGLALNRQLSGQSEGPSKGPRGDDWDSSTPSDRQTDSSEIDRRDREVLRLARSMTEQSVPRANSDATTVVNPFNDTSDPELDPHSGKFKADAWLHQLLKIINRDPERYPKRSAGVSYRNLSVHGFGSPTDFQKSVGNIFLEIPHLLSKLSGKSQRKVQILTRFDGVVKAGEMLVVLGRPGSGCSTLLKTVAGMTHGYHVDETSNINYQGITPERMQREFRGEVIYQAETDVHFPQLTVGQTLLFAAKAKAPRNRFPGVTRDQYAEHMRDAVMTIFGLSHTLHTKVGNDFVRGVSGGERKRVSIAEVTLAGAPLQCWDNATRGLDSATALEFVKTLRLSTEMAETTAIVAIYQASQSIYEMFDKVVVLYEGQQIFFGHKDAAKQYFLDLGFVCPARQTTADFLTSLTSAVERVVAPGFENRVPRTPEEFAQVWQKSEARAALLREIDGFENDHPIGGEKLEQFQASRKAQKAAHMRPNSPYTISVPMQVKLCMTRGFQRLQGDLTIFITTVFGNSVLALVIGSVFYNLSDTADSFFSRGALLFFAILLNALASSLEILTLYAQRPIVEKHSQYALYHPFSEALSSMICDLPSKILVSVTFNLALYFLTNLRREVGAFFFFLLFSSISTLVMSSVFRTIAATSRTLSEAMTPAALFILALIIYTGFVIPTVDMHPWFRWINYINPIGYAFESLMINEFFHRSFRCTTFIPQGPGYENLAPASQICSVVGAVTGSDLVDGGVYIAQSYNYLHSHKWRNLGILIAFWIFFSFTYLYATEKIQGAKSKGEVLLFRRGRVAPAARQREDEEALAGRQAVVDEKHPGHDVSAVILRQTATFHWRDVCYDIKIKKETRRILDLVDGWVKPGTLTALMGASGAGKTTLLDVLASRVTMGVVTGEILVDGQLRDGSFQRKTGYVQQQDIHLETTTVREALQFSALLRQPRTTPKQEKLDYVEEVIKLMEMEDYADAVVGVPGEGLNVEQRKRTTIGVELAAKPQLLLFLDEPTSGLDSQTSWSICSLIQKLANNGQAILCTIHQPSAVLFQRFDRLLLLARGGQTVYFGDIGEDSRTFIDYFERHGARPCAAEENPAEWMLEVIGAAPGSHSEQNWPELWRASSEFEQVHKTLDVMQENLSQLPRTSTPEEQTPFAVRFPTQLQMCTKRVFEQYWRTPSYIYAKLTLSTLTGLFIGFTFWKNPLSQQGLQNQMLSVFMLLTIFGNLVQQMMPYFVKQRALYEARERPSKTYSWQTFMIANIIVELPWNTLVAVILFFTFYYPTGMYQNAVPTGAVHERGALFFLLIWSFLMFTSTFSAMAIAGAETAENGGNTANMLFTMCLIFCGVLATPETLPGFWIFMYRVSPFTYLVSGLLGTGVANAPVTCAPLEIHTLQPPSGMTCGDFLGPFATAMAGAIYNPSNTTDCQYCAYKDTNGFLNPIHAVYGDRWRNFGLMWVYIGFNVAGALFIYWLLRVPKNKRKGV